jgi:PAS domain-containing protein
VKLSVVSAAPLIALAVIVAGTGGLAVLRAVRRRQRLSPASLSPEEKPAVPEPNERATLRSYAIDALGEAVLILDREGRIRDCNGSALTLFDRHRGSIEEQFATTLRRFEGLDQSDPHRVASQQAVWVGEAWTRQPDGGVKLCLARVIAVRDGGARVTGFVEAFRDVTAERALSEEFRDLLYGVRSFDSVSVTPKDNVRAVRDELRLLSEAFRDLDLVIRQYERLLPALSADDPLTESIAGAAHDARAAVAAVGVPTLLEEVPRALARLRGHLQQLAIRMDAGQLEPEEESGTDQSSVH